jgi:AcrR family transcriptional regulator
VPNPRAAVLAAAFALIDEHSLAGLRVQEVARRAGVATRTVYREFGSRDQLVVEVVQEAARQIRGRIDDAYQRKLVELLGPRSARPTPTEILHGTIRAAFEGFILFAAEHERYFRMLFDEGPGVVPAVVPVLGRIFDDFAQDNLRKLRMGQPNVVRIADELDLEIVAHALVGMLTHLARVRLYRSDLSASRVLDVLVDQVVFGLRRRGDRVDPRPVADAERAPEATLPAAPPRGGSRRRAPR